MELMYWTAANVGINNVWGGLYEGAIESISNKIFPSDIPFTSAPIVTIGQSGYEGDYYPWMLEYASPATTRKTGIYFAVSPVSNNTALIKCGIIISGRWK